MTEAKNYEDYKRLRGAGVPFYARGRDALRWKTKYEMHVERQRAIKSAEDAILQEFADSGDPVNHPPHYTSHPSGVECIQITEHMGFCLGNAVKYIWRADLKGNAIEDLKKARFYIDREIERREKKAD